MTLPHPEFENRGQMAIEKNTGIRVWMNVTQDLDNPRIVMDHPDLEANRKLDDFAYMSGMFHADDKGHLRSLHISGFRAYYSKYLRPAGYSETDMRRYLIEGAFHTGYFTSPYPDFLVQIEN